MDRFPQYPPHDDDSDGIPASDTCCGRCTSEPAAEPEQKRVIIPAGIVVTQPTTRTGAAMKHPLEVCE